MPSNGEWRLFYLLSIVQFKLLPLSLAHLRIGAPGD